MEIGGVKINSQLALAPMAGIRLLEVRCRYEPAADKAELDCRFSWSGQELETTLEV